jgi:hypothetical protein
MSLLMTGAAVIGSALVAPSLAVGLALSPQVGTQQVSRAADTGRSQVAQTQVAQTQADQQVDLRIDEACRQIPIRLARVKAAQDRLAAGATTRGSIAFLEARIARAEAAGQDDAARLLGNRLATRRDLAAALPDVLVRLEDSQQVCTDRAATSSTSS